MNAASTMRLQCNCGARIRVPHEAAGRWFQCPKCQTFLRAGLAEAKSPPSVQASAPIPVRSQPERSAPQQTPPRLSSPVQSAPHVPLAPTTPAIHLCSICQCCVESGDAITRCEICKLPYHSECWDANFGCAAYGCSQVGALKKEPDIRIASFTPVREPARRRRQSVPDEAVPAEHIAVAVSVLCFLLGLIAFGVPSLLSGVYSIYLLLRSQRCRHVGLVIAALMVSVLGLVAGIVIRVRP
jgi:hypothetical protein